MDLCIAGRIRKWYPAYVSSAQEQIEKKRCEMDKLRRPAHPAVVLELVMLEELSAEAD